MRQEMIGGLPVVAKRILIKFKKVPSSADLARISAAADGIRLQPLGGSGWYRLDSASLSAAALLAALAPDAAVDKIEPDAIGRVAVPKAMAVRRLGTPPRRPFSTTPNDTDFSLQWALQNTGQTVAGIAGTSGADIGATAAWDHTTGSSGVAVAVVDTGVDYSHADLAGNMWSAPAAYTITEGGNVYHCPAGSHGFNAIDNYSGCSGQEADANGHGTAVAGIIGAVGNNGSGTAGVNWTTSMISIVGVESSGATVVSEIVTALDALLQIKNHFGSSANVAALNMSFIVQGSDDALKAEMSLVGNDGIMMLVGAGNDCVSYLRDPAAFGVWGEMAVGASDQFDQRAYWGSECSNGGAGIAAPGKNDLSTTNGGGDSYFAGTSDATPHVTGSAALLLAGCPLTMPAALATLKGTADYRSALSAVSSGLRLNVGSALASCSTGTAGTGPVYVDLEGQGTGMFNQYGSITVTVDGISTWVNYDTSYDTTDSIGYRVADALSGPWTTATYVGNGEIDVVTNALGPYTGYSLGSSVEADCTPSFDCDPPPTISTFNLTAGHN